MTQDEIKRKIFVAGQKVFDEKGFHDANLSDVAETAGVDISVVKSYCPTKEKLLNEILSEGIGAITAFLHKIVNDRGKADAKVGKIVREVLRQYEAYYPMFKLISINMESLNQEDLEIKGVLEHEKIEKYRQNTAVIGRIVAKGQMDGLFSDVNPLEAAYLLRGMIMSAIKYWQATGKNQPLENYADTIIRVFLKGITK